MAIVHADDFEVYGRNTAFMTDGVYAQIIGISLAADPDGTSSGTVVAFSGAVSNTLRIVRKVLSASTLSTGVVGRYWLSRIPANVNEVPLLAQFRNSSNTSMFSVTIDPSGRVQARAGGEEGTILGSSNNPVVSPNGWYHFESKLAVDPVNGLIEVRVEGRTVLKLENLNTGNTPVQQVVSGSRTATTQYTTYFKDFVIWDGSGTQNVDFIGTVLLEGLDLAADVSLNWTPVGAATGAAILDNRPPNAAQYLSAIDPPPAAYVGSMTDLPDDVTSVKGIVTYIRAAKIDGGDASLQVGLISSPDDAPETVEGADRPISVAQTYWMDVFEQDPKTLAPWTPQAVNGVNFKLNRTS